MYMCLVHHNLAKVVNRTFSFHSKCKLLQHDKVMHGKTTHINWIMHGDGEEMNGWIMHGDGEEKRYNPHKVARAL